MRVRLTALSAIVLGTLALALAAAAAAQGATFYVEMKNAQFSPQSLTISPGDTVVWINNDTFAHDVTFESGGIGSGAGAIAAAGNWSHTFSADGTFKYRCTLHSGNFDSGMAGTLMVGTSPAPAPPRTPGFEAAAAALAFLTSVGLAAAMRRSR